MGCETVLSGSKLMEILGDESYRDHQLRMEQVAGRARKVSWCAVIEAPAEISRVVDEGFGLLLACVRDESTLRAAGITSWVLDGFRKLVYAMNSAQRLWRIEVAMGPTDPEGLNIKLARNDLDRIYTVAVAEAGRIFEVAILAFGGGLDDERLAVFRSRYHRMM